MTIKNLASSRRQGFTLIEMLVSLVILSSVILIATSGYSTYMSRWDSNFGKFNQTAAQLQLFQGLHRTVTNTRPYIVKNQAGVYHFYFEGKETELTAVSAASLNDPDRAALYRLKVELNEGWYELTYSEVDTSKSWLEDPTKEKNWTIPVVILRMPNAMTFDYFGWKSMSDFNDKLRVNRGWSPQHSGEASGIVPDFLRITFKDEEQSPIILPLLQWDYQYINRMRGGESV